MLHWEALVDVSDLSDGGFAHHTIRARNLEDVARPRQNKSAPKRATHVGLDTFQRCHESCGRRGATHDRTMAGSMSATFGTW